MASTGNIRVNGGFESAVNMQSGSLFFVAITGVDFSGYKAAVDGFAIPDGAWSNDFIVAEGKSIPDSAAEVAYELISKRATPIALHVDDAGNMHVILENNVQGWLVNSPQDNVSSKQPGIVPRPVGDDMTSPSLQAALQALGTVTVNDAVGGYQSTVDFSTALVSYSDVLLLDVASMTAE